MDFSRLPVAPDEGALDPVRAISKRIAVQCVLAGLGAPDAEDLAQDIWEWLIRSGNVAAAAVSPWLFAVTANFVRRHRRRRMREKEILQEFGAEGGPRTDSLTKQIEDKQFLDRLASRAKGSERRLLGLLRQDLRLSEASRCLGIPKGSEQFHLRNLRRKARRLRRPTPLRPISA